jgi:hypothetical protein
MERMRVVVNVGVVFDAETYTDAGQILDAVATKLDKVLAGKGRYEITGFQTRPCKAAKFDRMAYAEPQAMMEARAMPEGPDPDRF